MVRINVVYQNANMPGDELPPIQSPDGAYRVQWSRQVKPGFDAVVYFNHYTYNRRLHDRICPEALRILYMFEPVAVDPMQYTQRVWKQFDAILTWNTYLTESSSAFTFEPGTYYDVPYCSRYGVTPLTGLPDLATREKALCQICGDKYSLSAEQLYSKRRKVARWFHRHGHTRMDVYGIPPMDTPNYRGSCVNKAETFARYRYALCFENTYHPLWTKGYLTEKILDCMASLTVPVYYGCSNIEELVPADCFVDFRRFSTLNELDEFLQTMTDREYCGYAERMQKFMIGYKAAERHSLARLYETVVSVCGKTRSANPPAYPPDYSALSSFGGKCRLLAMRLLLPHHRLVYPIFSAVRAVNKGIKK